MLSFAKEDGKEIREPNVEASVVENLEVQESVAEKVEGGKISKEIQNELDNVNALAEIESQKSQIAKAKAAVKNQAQAQATAELESRLGSFGFGPALFAINYNKNVIQETEDVKLRGDGTIGAKGSKFATSFGLEIHYDFNLSASTKCFSDCENKANYNISVGHVVSPFVGLYDLDNGIKGTAYGLLYGYWKGDRKGENKTSLNMGVGWTVHKDRLVLAKGVKEGLTPATGIKTEDYTERQDVEGVIFMLSVNMGF